MAISAPLQESDIDFDCSHKVIGALMEVLQGSFKQETNYRRPLISPQMNIVFAVDSQTAIEMARYMKAKLVTIGGFMEDEFRFTHKSSMDGEGLQRLRLEFTDGVTLDTMRKLMLAINSLKQGLKHH